MPYSPAVTAASLEEFMRRIRHSCNDWILPHKDQSGKNLIKNLNNLFAEEEGVRGSNGLDREVTAEDTPSITPPSQRSKPQKSELPKEYFDLAERMKVRGSYNNTDNNKENNTDRLQGRISTNERIEPYRYYSTSFEEERCKEIAIDLEEKHMNFILSQYRKYGLTRIETAWGRYREDRERGKYIDNPRAYLNGILKKLSAET